MMAEEFEKGKVVVTIRFDDDVFKEIDSILKNKWTFSPSQKISMHDLSNQLLREALKIKEAPQLLQSSGGSIKTVGSG